MNKKPPLSCCLVRGKLKTHFIGYNLLTHNALCYWSSALKGAGVQLHIYTAANGALSEQTNQSLIQHGRPECRVNLARVSKVSKIVLHRFVALLLSAEAEVQRGDSCCRPPSP